MYIKDIVIVYEDEHLVFTTYGTYINISLFTTFFHSINYPPSGYLTQRILLTLVKNHNILRNSKCYNTCRLE